jgi:hypothetical protein
MRGIPSRGNDLTGIRRAPVMCTGTQLLLRADAFYFPGRRRDVGDNLKPRVRGPRRLSPRARWPRRDDGFDGTRSRLAGNPDDRFGCFAAAPRAIAKTTDGSPGRRPWRYRCATHAMAGSAMTGAIRTGDSRSSRSGHGRGVTLSGLRVAVAVAGEQIGPSSSSCRTIRGWRLSPIPWSN